MQYKLYTVNNSIKSKVHGYWVDKGKVYIDYIHIKAFNNRRGLELGIKELFAKGEKAVFFTEGGRAKIKSQDGQETILSKRQVLKRDKLSPSEVKTLLKSYGGLTIWNRKRSRGLYFIEVWEV